MIPANFSYYNYIKVIGLVGETYMVVNAMEKIMKDLLDEYLDRFQMRCTCEKCKTDLLALVLNKVPPYYVTDQNKIPYIKAKFADKQELTSLIVKLAECAKIISERPLCETMKQKQKEVEYD
ncbi:late competence development ComFB family protein [Bacillus alveayuensis]|uniref:late competence development ComFB family protein n=1 Tax=Aeribacillus alveayuensis TaxID=279215 RepID=UPI000B1CD750